jgi:hypothetical protein
VPTSVPVEEGWRREGTNQLALVPTAVQVIPRPVAIHNIGDPIDFVLSCHMQSSEEGNSRIALGVAQLEGKVVVFAYL